MDFFAMSPLQWGLTLLAAYITGFSKAGFGGVGMLGVALMMMAMKGHEMESTGTILPMMIAADLMVARTFRHHIDWAILLRLLPPAVLGVVLAFLFMGQIGNQNFRPLVGGIVLALASLHLYRKIHPSFMAMPPRGKPFAWAMGTLGGVTTMLANAGGPVMTLYFLALRLTKMELVSTAAWYFLIVNFIKVPFSMGLGLISGGSLMFNVLMLPAIALGIFTGKKVLHSINQTWFDRILFVLICSSALYLLF